MKLISIDGKKNGLNKALAGTIIYANDNSCGLADACLIFKFQQEQELKVSLQHS